MSAALRPSAATPPTQRVARAALAAVLLAATASAVRPAPAHAVDVDPPVAFFIETSYLATYDHAVLWVWEVIDPTSIPDPADFTVRIDGVPEPAVDVDFVYQGLVGSPLLSDIGLTQGTAFLEVRWSTPAPAGSEIRFDYVPGTHPIRDQAGNQLAAMPDAELIPLDAIDFVPIVPFIDEGAGPDTLVLFFGQPLAPDLPAAGDFTVALNGGPALPASAIDRRHDHLGATFLYLTLAEPVAPGDIAHVTYIPGPTELRDRNGDPIGPFDLDPVVSLAAIPTRQTDVGTDVVVAPADTTTGAQLATIAFDAVTAAGSTTLVTTETAPPLPAGFSVGDPPTFYDLGTTATFAGAAEVCIRYGAADYDDPASLRLLHFEDGAWADVTTSHDLVLQTICGSVSSFSPFAVAQRSFDVAGFFAPVDNLPVANVVNAGSAVPIKFGLGGDFGLDILAADSPLVRGVACPDGGPIDVIEQTVANSTSGLVYDAASGQYVFTWKTDRAWGGGCRELVLTLADGSELVALFRFR